jgi:Zn-dependent peptidase ImmA (M78 family)/DNA-binding XRE family transcriptional regulator
MAALITPSVLRWARQRAQLDPERLAQKTHVKADKLLRWEQGDEKPTFKQAQELARILNIPFGYLFLPHPPQEMLPIPDLRTIRPQPYGQLSLELRDLLADVLRKQDWYRDYLVEQGAEKLPFIGRFTLATPVARIAQDIAVTLNLSLENRKATKNGEDFLNLLSMKAEEAEIWVMRSGIVGNNTHRPLDVEEFRGFVIADDFAPVVFINSKDAKAAQIFTLAHELAHLWLGQSGISNPSLARPLLNQRDRVEKVCNAVAAELLVPQQDLLANWDEQATLEQNASQLARYFRVSTVVIARRALELGLVDWSIYHAYYQQQAAQWIQPRADESQGGNYYRTLPIRNGRRFTATVVQSALEHGLLLRDAGKLLGISPAKISQLAREIGAT